MKKRLNKHNCLERRREEKRKEKRVEEGRKNVISSYIRLNGVLLVFLS